jgi:hypothetical protein
MGLRALRRHRHLPAAAALIGLLLYTALVTSHIVSQGTHATVRGAPGAAAHSVAFGDLDCHHSLPAAGKGNGPGRTLPDSPPTKCPFCTGYAVLLVGVAGGSVDLVAAEAAAQSFESLGRAQLVYSASLPSWRPRAPPAFA